MFLVNAPAVVRFVNSRCQPERWMPTKCSRYHQIYPSHSNSISRINHKHAQNLLPVLILFLTLNSTTDYLTQIETLT